MTATVGVTVTIFTGWTFRVPRWLIRMTVTATTGMTVIILRGFGENGSIKIWMFSDVLRVITLCLDNCNCDGNLWDDCGHC